MTIRKTIMQAKAAPVKRAAVQAPNAAAAQRIKFDRGVVTAIRDTNARVGALADAVEKVQSETVARVGRMTAKAVRAAKAAAAQQPQAAPAPAPVNPEQVAAILAKWEAEREADRDRCYEEYLDAYSAAEAVGDKALMDALTDGWYETREAIEWLFTDKWSAALPPPDTLPTSDSLTEEWDREKAAMNAAWKEQSECYWTEAALDAGYERFSAKWDAAWERYSARWDAARARENAATAHEDRMEFATDHVKNAKDLPDLAKLSELIFKLQLAAIDGGQKLPAPFDGACAFTLDDKNYFLTGGLPWAQAIDELVAACGSLEADLEFES